jgi:hypothetical protein
MVVWRAFSNLCLNFERVLASSARGDIGENTLAVHISEIGKCAGPADTSAQGNSTLGILHFLFPQRSAIRYYSDIARLVEETLGVVRPYCCLVEPGRAMALTVQSGLHMPVSRAFSNLNF